MVEVAQRSAGLQISTYPISGQTLETGKTHPLLFQISFNDVRVAGAAIHNHSSTVLHFFGAGYDLLCLAFASPFCHPLLKVPARAHTLDHLILVLTQDADAFGSWLPANPS